MLLKGELGNVTLWPPCCCDPVGLGFPGNRDPRISYGLGCVWKRRRYLGCKEGDLWSELG